MKKKILYFIILCTLTLIITSCNDDNECNTRSYPTDFDRANNASDISEQPTSDTSESASRYGSLGRSDEDITSDTIE